MARIPSNLALIGMPGSGKSTVGVMITSALALLTIIHWVLTE
jgi:shikimate kinase